MMYTAYIFAMACTYMQLLHISALVHICTVSANDDVDGQVELCKKQLAEIDNLKWNLRRDGLAIKDPSKEIDMHNRTPAYDYLCMACGVWSEREREFQYNIPHGMRGNVMTHTLSLRIEGKLVPMMQMFSYEPEDLMLPSNNSTLRTSFHFAIVDTWERAKMKINKQPTPCTSVPMSILLHQHAMKVNGSDAFCCYPLESMDRIIRQNSHILEMQAHPVASNERFPSFVPETVSWPSYKPRDGNGLAIVRTVKL